ncbi:MAG: glutathione S-transferase family protein [Solirubrobacterales bacterium]|nr:glutathione S-transferase family protein [Solirubrobacterales bacterium]
MRIHTIPDSTNAERVALALGLKGVTDVTWITHDPEDRSGIRAVSGQELVPVVEADGRVLTDSMPIVAWIDRTWPDPPLWPAGDAARREVDGFVSFFNFVWKVPPNAIDGARRAGAPDDARIPAWAEQLRAWRHGFEALLHGRDFLFGDQVGAADLCAYPFLKFAVPREPDDDLFHGVLVEHLALDGGFPRLKAWIRRMDGLPRA